MIDLTKRVTVQVVKNPGQIPQTHICSLSAEEGRLFACFPPEATAFGFPQKLELFEPNLEPEHGTDKQVMIYHNRSILSLPG
jgi:hypothetical protein